MGLPNPHRSLVDRAGIPLWRQRSRDRRDSTPTTPSHMGARESIRASTSANPGEDSGLEVIDTMTNPCALAAARPLAGQHRQRRHLTADQERPAQVNLDIRQGWRLPLLVGVHSPHEGGDRRDLGGAVRVRVGCRVQQKVRHVGSRDGVLTDPAGGRE